MEPFRRSTKETTVNVPSNRDINQAMDTAGEVLEQTKVDQKRNLTPEGHELINQTERVIESARVFVNEKNPGDTLQRIIKEGNEFYNDTQVNRRKWADLQKLLSNPQENVDTAALLKKMESVSKTTKLVAIELVSSASFRQNVYDFFSILYAIVIDSSQIDKIGKPLKEALQGNFDAEKLKKAGEKALRLGLDYADPGKSVVKLNDEQKQVLWKQFKTVMNAFSDRERTQRLVNGIFEILELIYRPIYQISNDISQTKEKVLADQHIQNVLTLSQELFEAFTRTSMEPLLSQARVVYSSVAEDKEMEFQLRRMKDWILAVLENPQSLAQDATYDHFNDIIDTFSKSLQQKSDLKYNFMEIRNEINRIVWNLEDDPITQSLQQDIKALVEMILLDDKGKVTWKPEVLDQLKLILLSAVVKRLRFPLAPISVDDPNLSFRLQGMILGIQDVLPERIVAENRGIAVINVKDKTLEKTQDEKRADYFDPTIEKASEAIKIRVENINLHVSDADLWFHKKTFPEMEANGKARIDIGGDGMDLVFVLKTEIGSDRLFSLARVECNIHDLDLKLEQTEHDIIYNMMISLFKGNIKRTIEDTIQDSMVTLFDQMNEQIGNQVTFLKGKMPSLSTLTTAMAFTQ